METQRFLGQAFVPVTAGRGKLFTLALCLCPDCRSWGHPMAVTFPGAAPGRVASAGGSETASLVFQAMLDRKGHTKANILCKLLLVREQALVL